MAYDDAHSNQVFSASSDRHHRGRDVRDGEDGQNMSHRDGRTINVTGLTHARLLMEFETPHGDEEYNPPNEAK